jgi:hypothetical protein
MTSYDKLRQATTSYDKLRQATTIKPRQATTSHDKLRLLSTNLPDFRNINYKDMHDTFLYFD